MIRAALVLLILLAGCTESVPDFNGQVTAFVTCEDVGDSVATFAYYRNDIVASRVQLAQARAHEEGWHIRDARAYPGGCKAWLKRHRTDAAFSARAESDAALGSIGAGTQARRDSIAEAKP